MTLQTELIIFVSLCLIAGKLVGLPPFRKRREPASDWWAWYNVYLKSPEWQQKREGVLLRSQGRCERCGRSGRLSVHHLTYERVGHELPWDLAALCYDCHKGEHPGKRF